MNESMTHPMSTVLKGENMAPEPATYAWPGEDPVPLATTQFPRSSPGRVYSPLLVAERIKAEMKILSLS